MYAGRVACCPLVSHSKYTDGTDRQTDGWTPDHYKRFVLKTLYVDERSSSSVYECFESTIIAPSSSQRSPLTTPWKTEIKRRRLQRTKSPRPCCCSSAAIRLTDGRCRHVPQISTTSLYTPTRNCTVYHNASIDGNNRSDRSSTRYAVLLLFQDCIRVSIFVDST